MLKARLDSTKLSRAQFSQIGSGATYLSRLKMLKVGPKILEIAIKFNCAWRPFALGLVSSTKNHKKSCLEAT